MGRGKARNNRFQMNVSGEYPEVICLRGEMD